MMIKIIKEEGKKYYEILKLKYKTVDITRQISLWEVTKIV